MAGPDREGTRPTGPRRARTAGLVVAAVVGVLLVAELAAGPILARMTSSALEPCLPHDRLEVTSASRPLAPRVLVGRPGDIEVAGEGVVVRNLRLARVEATLPDARLPWAPGSPTPTEMRFEVEVAEEDLQEWMRSAVPFGVPLTVELASDGATVGVERLPFAVSLRVTVTDGVLTVQPAAGDQAWWRSLGLATTLPLPDDVHVDRLVLGDARLDASLRAEVEPELSGDGLCAPWEDR